MQETKRMERRAEWLPVERRRRHPDDVRTGTVGLGCGWLALVLLVPFLDVDPGGRIVFWTWVKVLCLLPLGAWLSVRLVRRRREVRAFAEIGPGDADMARVRVEIFRGEIPLGSDEGYLWSEGRTTSFQGSRVAFRVGGPGWHAQRRGGGRVELWGPERERVVMQRSRDPHRVASALPIALDGPGPFTPPPLVCDPGMRPPSLVWRVPSAVLSILLWFVLTFAEGDPDSVFWLRLIATVVVGGVLMMLVVPVLLDRRGRRG